MGEATQFFLLSVMALLAGPGISVLISVCFMIVSLAEFCLTEKHFLFCLAGHYQFARIGYKPSGVNNGLARFGKRLNRERFAGSAVYHLAFRYLKLVAFSGLYI